MTSELFYNLIKLVTSFIATILTPIDTIIAHHLPSVSNAFTKVGFLLDYINGGLAWAISLSGIPNDMLSLIFVYFTFKLSVPFIQYSIKLGLKWFHYLKV